MNEGTPQSGDAVGYGETMPGGLTHLPPGFAVGEYRIEAVLGQGGMGTVYLAVQPVIEKKVAIKVLGAQFSSTPELVRRFVDEARAVNRIGHENIIDIFSFGQLADGRHYFVMEYLQGATLRERLDEGDLQAQEVAPLLLQICDALEAAHAKKIVHRDLKLENIWIATGSRGHLAVRLLDFGIAKLLETGEGMATDVGAVLGTPQYMSPEQCHGQGVDHRTDIYAMGVILYRIASGHLPIQGQTYAEIISRQLWEIPAPPSTHAPVPAKLERLIMSCLEKDPALRPQSASELRDALASLMGWGTVPVPGPSSASSSEASSSVALAGRPHPRGTLTQVKPRLGQFEVEPTPGRNARRGGRGFVPVVVGLTLAGAVAAGLGWWNHRRIAVPPIVQPKVIVVEPKAPSIEKDVAVTVVVPHGAAHDVKATEGQKHHPSPGGKVSPGISKDTSLNPPAHPSQASSKGLATDNPYGAPPDQQK